MTNVRSVFCRPLGLGLLCLGLGLAPASALAQDRLTAVPTVAAPVAAAVSDTELQTYTDGDRFSIQLPAAWQVASDEGEPLVITNFSQADPDRAPQPEDLRTEITWIEQPPGEVVPLALQEIQSQGYSLVNYGALRIDGTTALQLWLEDLPEAPESALITYIGYEAATAVIVSRYSTLTPQIQQLLTTVHGSFARR